MVSAAHRATEIKAIIFDVDGVLTDGGLYRTDDGQEIKRFHARDGLGMRMLSDAGLTLAIITGRTSDVVTHRSHELDIKYVYQGQRDKLPAFEEFCATLELEPSEVAYMGDDIVDMPVMRRAGLAMTVADAADDILAIAHWTSSRPGGNGAAREACEFLLKSLGLYGAAVERYMI